MPRTPVNRTEMGMEEMEAEIYRMHEEVTQQCRQEEAERKRQNLEVNAEAGPGGKAESYNEKDAELDRQYEKLQQCLQADAERERQNLEMQAEAEPSGRPRTPEIDPEVQELYIEHIGGDLERNYANIPQMIPKDIQRDLQSLEVNAEAEAEPSK
ncbi:hypothetical protein CEXT_252391 [Caerostris extrusa]|uniref:Uncharacterized protein n=1 Tax=Caerostris extrusa TaxID=172846 RepID=A0AAV4Q1E1_CAEEX|nr:hypothetical protein CEXT_252391 [Caerostris extrusa]